MVGGYQVHGNLAAWMVKRWLREQRDDGGDRALHSFLSLAHCQRDDSVRSIGRS